MVEGNPRPFVLFLWDGDNRKQLVDRSRKRTASDPDPEHGHLSMRDAAHHENTGRFTDLRDYCATATPPPTHAKRGGTIMGSKHTPQNCSCAGEECRALGETRSDPFLRFVWRSASRCMRLGSLLQQKAANQPLHSYGRGAHVPAVSDTPCFPAA